MSYFNFSDSIIHYNITGTGIPVVLLHGFLEDSHIFNTIIPALHTQGVQTITIDLPGHGRSTISEEAGSMNYMTQAVNELLFSVNIQPKFIIGHSMGGYVALELCRIRKELKVVLLHSNFWADSEMKKNDRDRVIEVVGKNKNLFIQEAIPNLFAPGNKIIYHQEIQQFIEKAKLMNVQNITFATIAMRNRQSAYDLVDTNVVAIIQGNDDPIISNQMLQAELSKTAQKAQVFYIQNCGHMGFIEKPDDIINCLTKVLIQ